MNFAGVYVFGYNRPFQVKENLVPIQNFRDFSSHSWPLYVFYAIPGDIEDAVKRFGNIIPIQIEPMSSIKDYDSFMTRKCFHVVNHECTLTFHSDGYLLKNGWEDFAGDYDYLGASWHRHIPDFDWHYKDNPFAKFNGYEKIHTTTTVGNGGFCFRKRSKMLEVERSVDWSTKEGDWLPDDVFYSFYGFGNDIFRPVSIEIADQWSVESLDNSDTFGFHCHT